MAHLHSELEKCGVVRLNLEYNLARVNKELAAEHRLRLDSDATVNNLQSMSSFSAGLNETVIIINQ